MRDTADRRGLRHGRDQHERREYNEMHGALQHSRAPGAEGQGRDIEGQNEQSHVGLRNAQRDLAAEHDRDQRHRRNCQPDAGDSGAQREIDAVLQPIAKGRFYRGEPLGHEHDERNDDADEGLRQTLLRE